MESIKKAGKSVYDYFRGYDALVKPSFARLHYEKDTAHKTLFGGILTFLVKIWVIQIAIEQGIRLANNWQPSISTQETAQLYDTPEVFLNETSKPMLEIWKGGNEGA